MQSYFGVFWHPHEIHTMWLWIFWEIPPYKVSILEKSKKQLDTEKVVHRREMLALGPEWVIPGGWLAVTGR